MKIKDIEQLDNGMQKKPYADHIYHWKLKVEDADEQTLLEFCRNNLKDAKREKKAYTTDYRASKNFNDTMEIVCGGWYSLTCNNDGSWDYIVHYAYID